MTAVINADGLPKIADIFSSATPAVLLKKDAATMEELKRRQGAPFVQPQRPIGMNMPIVKVACNCALVQVQDAMGLAVGPAQFAVETKGRCALLQWAIQMALEAKPNLTTVSIDNVNAYGEIERECIEASIKANPYLHSLLPLFKLFYKRGAGEL